MPLPALASPPFKSKPILKSWLKAVKNPRHKFWVHFAKRLRGERVDVGIFSPVLFRFYEGNLLFFFLNPIKATRANIRSGGIELSWKQVTGLLFNAGYFVILHSVHMGVKYVCQRVYPCVLCTSGVFPACAGSPTPPAKCVSKEPT